MGPATSQKIKIEIEAIIQKWFLIDPILFMVYCSHEIFANFQMKCKFRVGRGRIEYNPLLLNNINKDELELRLKIEIIRILLKHPYQRKQLGIHKEVQYLSSNLTILNNLDITDLNNDFIPKDIFAKYPKNKSFEEYCILMENDYPYDIDDYPDNPKSATDLWEEDGLKIEEINRLIQRGNKSSQDWGSLPAELIEIIKASTASSVNIAGILKRFKKSILSQKRSLTRMRPSRRYGFDQMGSIRAYTTKLLVGLDISGSVSSAMLSKTLGLINRIFVQGIEIIDVLQFDMEIKGDPQPIKKIIKKIKIKGRGGTNFQKVADFYIAHREYDGLIYLSDGKGLTPKVPERFSGLPVAWIIIQEKKFPYIINGWNLKSVNFD